MCYSALRSCSLCERLLLEYMPDVSEGQIDGGSLGHAMTELKIVHYLIPDLGAKLGRPLLMLRN